MEYREIENEVLVYDCLRYGKKPISTLMKNQKIYLKKLLVFVMGIWENSQRCLTLHIYGKGICGKKNEETSSVENFYSNVNLEEPDWNYVTNVWDIFKMNGLG